MTDRAEIEAIYRDFAIPLAAYRQLGAGRAAITSLAQNLWAILLAGKAMEEEYWEKLASDGHLEPEIVASVRDCYENEMKPRVAAEQLAALRAHYGIG
jgi:hypothetical protein